MEYKSRTRYKHHEYTPHNVKKIHLTREEINGLSRRFPYKELLNKQNTIISPDNVNTEKVDAYMIIPTGKPCYIWFTYFRYGNAAFIVSNYNGQLRFDLQTASFKDELAYGTLLSGTLMYHTINGRNNTFFCADDMIMYKGNKLEHMNIQERLSHISNLFTSNEVDNVSSHRNTLRFTVSMIRNDITKVHEELSSLQYKVHRIRMLRMRKVTPLRDVLYSKFIQKNTSNTTTVYTQDTFDTKQRGQKLQRNDHGFQADQNIQFIHNSRRSNITNSDTQNRLETRNNTKVLLVKPLPEPDTYMLYNINNSNGESKCYGKALIPSYKTSVYMNSIFRHIKENDSLDALEESDNEEEFQNVDEERYIKRNEVKMICEFQKKFRKWVPIRLYNTYTMHRH